MHTITRWRWRVLDPERGIRPLAYVAEAEALETDPGAERIEASRQVLEVPDNVDEHAFTSLRSGPLPR
jgi:hypothetical protein